MRSNVLLGVSVLLAVTAAGCTPEVQAQCQKYCQYIFLTCNAGPVTQTEAECAATCTEPIPTVNGATCTNPTAFYNCVLADQCAELQGPAGVDALEGCSLEAGCTIVPTNNGGNNGDNSNGGSTTGANNGSGNGTGGTTGGNTNGGHSGGSTNGGFPSTGASSNGGFISSSSNGANSSNGGLISSSSGGFGSTGGSSSTSFTSGGSTTGGAKPTIGMTCTPPAAQGDADPCAADSAGLVCNETATSVYTCTLPTEFEACLTSPGCSATTSDPPGLTCLDVPGFGLNGATAPACVNTCTSGVDCPDELTGCFDFGATSNICYYAFCGPTEDVIDGGFNGAGYYLPCDNAGTNDGLCLPFTGSDGTIGICEAAGTLANNAIGCAEFRSATAGTSTLCTKGTACLEGSANTFCSPVCGSSTPFAADGGPGCPAAEPTCQALQGVSWGACLETCTTGTTVCPTGMTCQVSSGSTGYCSP